MARWRYGDQTAHVVTLVFASLVVLVTALIVLELYRSSALTREKFGWSFLFSTAWDPVFERFGALPFVFGTVVTSALALLIAVPLGVGAAIFLAELAPTRVSDILSFVIELLAAVPSVIYGLLAIFTLVPFLRSVVEPALKDWLGFLPLFQGPAYGVGLLAAGLILAIMIVPYIVSISRDVLKAVPREMREAALALGATRWESTWNVVLPSARAGILGAIFLAMARALGETMAVTMVIGNDPKISSSLFAPGATIAAAIANEFTEATGDLYVSALIELGLVLFLLTIVLNGLARLLVLRTQPRGATNP